MKNNKKIDRNNNKENILNIKVPNSNLQNGEIIIKDNKKKN